MIAKMKRFGYAALVISAATMGQSPEISDAERWWHNSAESHFRAVSECVRAAIARFPDADVISTTPHVIAPSGENEDTREFRASFLAAGAVEPLSEFSSLVNELQDTLLSRACAGDGLAATSVAVSLDVVDGWPHFRIVQTVKRLPDDPVNLPR